MLKILKIREPHPILKPYVFCFFAAERGDEKDWSRECKIPSAQGILALCVQQWAAPRIAKGQILIAGPNPCQTEIPKTVKQFIGVKIGPGGFRSILGESPKEIRNLAVPLHHFWGFEASVLLERMCLATSLEERWDALEQALLKRVLRHGREDPYVREAMGFMEKSGWKLPAAKLSSQLGYSDRQIRNKFENWVGLGPREFQRVQRCRSLILRVLYGPRDKWIQMADEFGYFDQPHLSHEFKEFMGQGPEEFLQGLVSGVRTVEGRTEYGRRELFVLSYPS